MVEDQGHHPYVGVGILGHQPDLQVDRLVVGHRQDRIGPRDAGYLLSGGVAGGGDHHGNLELAGPQYADHVLVPLDGHDRHTAGLQPGGHGRADPTQPADHHMVAGLPAYAAGDRGQSRGDQQVHDQRGDARRENEPEELMTAPPNRKPSGRALRSLPPVVVDAVSARYSEVSQSRPPAWK